MEAFFLFLLFLFVFILFIILLNFKSSSAYHMQMMHKKLDKVITEVENLKPGIKTVSPEIKEKPILVETGLTQEKREPLIEKPPVEQEIPLLQEVKQELTAKVDLLSSGQAEKVIYKKEGPLKPARKNDFEKFIGENLLNKIGILLLVIALILFGKYAVDEGWLNETAKVFSIIIIGGVLIGIAHRLRINYKAFSSVLAGGGIAALYIAIAIGFQLYDLFSQSAAFAILVVITILAVMLSLAYDKKELAVIAILGGFATPLIVSTGEGNYKVLFTYILILDIGMLVLAYYKKWTLVNFVANFATVLLFMVWILDILFDNKILPHQGALLFVTAFYLVFFLMNIINNIKENSKFTAFEFIMVITNTFLYYWAGMIIINDLNPDYMGLFTILLGVFNFAFAFPLYRKKQIDKNLVFLLIGLVLTFASIAVPVQFKGNYITMFWAAEMVLLLWLSQQSGIRLMKLASYLVSVLMLISLIMDWDQIYFNRPIDGDFLPLLFNTGFMTGIVSVIAIFLILLLLKKDQDYLYGKSLSSQLFSSIYLVFFIITLYLVFLFEIAYQVDLFYTNSNLSYVSMACYNYVYLLAVLVWASRKQIRFLVHGLMAISFFGLLIYIFIVAPHYKQLMGSFLIGEISSSFGFLHYLTALSVLAICFYVWKNIKDFYKSGDSFKNISIWFAISIGVVVLSFELDYAVLHLTGPEYNYMQIALHQNHLIGWPILWGIIAFSLMFAGIKQNERILRVIGISLFFFAIAKFFIFDVWDMPAGGRIIAGASLAVLLLVISFLYQKLKKIIFEDEPASLENPVEEENRTV